MRRLGLVGVAKLNFKRGFDGRLWLIDVNPGEDEREMRIVERDQVVGRIDDVRHAVRARRAASSAVRRGIGSSCEASLSANMDVTLRPGRGRCRDAARAPAPTEAAD